MPRSARSLATLAASVLTFVGAVGGLGCGHTPSVTPGDPRVALAGLPARHDPAIALDDEEDRERAIKDFHGLPAGDPGRSAARAPLVAALAAELDAKLAKGATTEAIDLVREALELWEPGELEAMPAELAPLAPGIATLYDKVSSQGRRADAVLLMAALRTARPDQAARLDADFAALEAYLDVIPQWEGGPGDEAEVSSRANRYLENALPVLGSPWAARKLVDIVVARQDDVVKQLSAPGRPDGRAMVERYGTTVLRAPQTVVQAFALAGILDETPRALDRLPGGPFDDEDLRERLNAALAKDAGAPAWMALAATVLRKDGPQRTKAMTVSRLCAHAAKKLATSPELQVCLGVAARQLERTSAAIRAFENARRLDPQNATLAVELLDLYSRRIRELVAAERIDAAKGRLGELETALAEAKKLAPDLKTSALGDAIAVVALGHYNAGLIAESERLYARAAKEGAAAQAEEQLGQIAFRRGQFPAAAKRFDKAAALPRGTPIEQTYDGARLLQLAGDAWNGAGDHAEAEKRWKRASKAWDDLYQAAVLRAAPMGLDADDLEGKWASRLREVGGKDDDQKRQLALIFEMLGETFIGKARAAAALGQTKEALRSIERAVDSDSTESSTYANAISFLLLGGHYDEALDAYHRALGRRETTEYFKIYTSMWILEFGGMKKRAADPLALEFLASRAGRRWYHTLAAWRSGKMDDAALIQAADTAGERCEAYFYLGLRAAAKGDEDGAVERFRLTLATDMLGFFEYEMARALLTKGLPR